MVQKFSRIVFVALAALVAGEAAAQRYNPYADAHEALPPVAADGTIQWGTFFKSAQLQKSYERLWNLGACRGTNRAITEPVAANKLLIDRLPEAEFTGVVEGSSGGLAGGVVAFLDKAGGGQAAPLFAQLHPAGVSHLVVTGTVSRDDLRPGMMVQLRARVDARGKGGDAIERITVVTPAPDAKPAAVRPDTVETVVGSVLSCRGKSLVVRVDAGKVRRLTLTLADDVVVTVDGACLDLVAAGDEVAVKGRLWTGEGATGAGTIFASHVTVTKRVPPLPETRAVAVGAGAGAGRPVE
jgi:hypothetical protein